MRVHADLADLLTEELLLPSAEVAVAAGQVDICRHVVASFDMVDVASDRHHVAGELMPWNQRRFGAGNDLRRMWTSVPQMPHMSTCSATSFGPASGTGTRSTRRSFGP